MRSWIRFRTSGLGLFIAFATTGCLENGVGTPARGPNPAAVSATLATDLRSPEEARSSLFGDVVLFTAPGMGVALAIDGGTSPGTQDGYVDQVFLLQQEAPPALQPRRLSSAELFYAGRLLMVRAAGAPPLTFAVQDAGDPEPAVDRLPFSASGAERFTGYGISRRTGAWQIPLDEVTASSMSGVLPSCTTPQDGTIRTAQLCDSGGEGSTSCSTSCAGVNGGSCSTTCGTGYYSCCDRGACQCTCVASSGGTPVNETSVLPRGSRP
jgi:hypothetical protein